MIYLKNFKSIALLLAFMVPFTFAAAPKSGKVRLVIGDVTFQKGGKAKWVPLRVDGKVKEKDKIKTASESTASIAFPDGSIVAVAELSEVEFSQLVFADGNQISMVDVKQGQLRFDAQKQKQGNSFKFKTGTATCSIRGTDGIIGITKNGQSIGSLNSGLMDMEQEGQVISIKSNQFVAFRKGKSPIVGDAKNAGDPDFMKKIADIVDDSTKSDTEIMATVKTIDEEIEKNKVDLKNKYNCKFDELPQIIDTNSVKIGVHCTKGVDVSIGAETFKSIGEKLIFSPNWEKSAFGEKKFVAMCSVEKQTFECGRVSTLYKVERSAEFGISDEGECTVAFLTHGYSENKGSLKFFMEDSLLQDIILNADTSGTFKLLMGNKNYTIQAESDDPKQGKLTKKFKCYPSTEVVIELKGETKEVIKKKVSQGAVAYPELEFTIRNVLNNDPNQIKSVEIKIGNKVYSGKMSKSANGITYKSRVPIQRGKNVEVYIVVTMKNGMVASTHKTYEFL